MGEVNYPPRKQEITGILSESVFDKERDQIAKELESDSGLIGITGTIIHRSEFHQREFFPSLAGLIASQRLIFMPSNEASQSHGDAVKALEKLHGHISKSLNIVTGELSQSVERGLSGRLPHELSEFVGSEPKISGNAANPIWSTHEHQTCFAWLLLALREASDSYLSHQRAIVQEQKSGRAGSTKDHRFDDFIWRLAVFIREFLPDMEISKSRTKPFYELCHYIAASYLGYDKELTRAISNTLDMFNARYETGGK